MSDEKKIKVSKNGPYIVSGSIPMEKDYIVADSKGIPVSWKKGEIYPLQKNFALCRCGSSGSKPFCDGTHASINFDGTETATRKPFSELAEMTTGPELDLADAECYCARALFCHRAGNTWNLTEKSGDPEAKQTAIQEACDCPSGRLVAMRKKSGGPYEPKFEPSIGIAEIPAEKMSGPIWVKGGVPVESADGFQYEVRNRVTLCRCGRSAQKPFCDGSHCDIKFNDGDASIQGSR